MERKIWLASQAIPFWDTALDKLVNRYYVKKHGAVKQVIARNNLLGSPSFREVTFSDGYVANFCAGAYEGIWFRNERSEAASSLPSALMSV